LVIASIGTCQMRVAIAESVAASALGFRPLVFAPLARRGIALALFAAFFASAVSHTLLAYMAMVRWKISLVCGAFFVVQPLLILAERRMNVRRWPTAGANGESSIGREFDTIRCLQVVVRWLNFRTLGVIHIL
jgi:hypothetical protein